MRLKSAFFGLVAVCTLTATAAVAQDEARKPYEGPYVGAIVGLEFIDRGADNNIGFNYGALAGWRTHIRERVVVGGYGRYTESSTAELDVSTNLNTEVAETWSLGGTIGYMFYSDYLVSAEIGYAETSINSRGAIELDPFSPGDPSVIDAPLAETGSQGGLRLAVSFERPFMDFLNLRSTVSRTEIGSSVDRWAFDVGLALHF